MPFPKTWVEELVIEWLHIEGFLVEANLPVGVTTRGGRLEADIVGARISNNTLEVIHIETGVLAEGQKGTGAIMNKFSSSVRQSVTNYFGQRLSFTSNKVNYQKFYFPTYWTKPTVTALTRSGVEVDTLPDFICNRVLPTIQRWKQNPPHQPRTRGKRVALPESYWLLQLIDYLNTNGMLKCTKND